MCVFCKTHTLLLCIFLFCIFLLYRTDPQVEVQIRILLNSLSAESVQAGEKVVATYSIFT